MDTERQKWYQYITVEPIMFLYMFAFQLTSVIEQDFFVKKACRANLNYTDDICNNLNAHNTSKEAVHVSLILIESNKSTDFFVVLIQFNLKFPFTLLAYR